MISCQACRNYMHPVKLCSLGLAPKEYFNEDLLRLGVGTDVLLPSMECSEYTEEYIREPLITDVLKTIGRDESFKSIPRWIRGFLSKDYFLCSLEGWVLFLYPEHIKDLKRYKEVIFKHKDPYVLSLSTKQRDNNDKRRILLGVTKGPTGLPPLIRDNLYNAFPI